MIMGKSSAVPGNPADFQCSAMLRSLALSACVELEKTTLYPLHWSSVDRAGCMPVYDSSVLFAGAFAPEIRIHREHQARITLQHTVSYRLYARTPCPLPEWVYSTTALIAFMSRLGPRLMLVSARTVRSSRTLPIISTYLSSMCMSCFRQHQCPLVALHEGWSLRPDVSFTLHDHDSPRHRQKPRP